MNPPTTPHFLLLLLLVITIALTTTPSQTPKTVHTLLKSKGLPPGLLPKEVKSYQYNTTNGDLQVYLDGPCLAEFENRVYFESVIRANLSYGSLLGVHGLSQEELFIWFPVKEIEVTDPQSGVIYFDIGMAHKQFSFSLFEDPPSCKPQHDTRIQGSMSYKGRKELGMEVE